jgi:hypothetical protein
MNREYSACCNVPLVHLHFLEQVASLSSDHAPDRTELHGIDELRTISAGAVDLRGKEE